MGSSYPESAVAYLHPGEVSAAFTMSLVELMMYEAGRGMPPFVIANRCASGGLPAARNKVVAQFLDGTHSEWLLFVDSDMGFAPDSLQRLIASADPVNRPLVGGLCFGLRHSHSVPETNAERFVCFPTIYAWRDLGDSVGFQVVEHYPRDEVVEVSATGAAFLLMHRSALKEMRRKHGDEWFSIVTHPTGPTVFSEDMSFCVRAAASDLPLFVDTSVKTCHDKHGIFLDEECWDRQLRLEASAPTPELAHAG